jgi:hypothetical protein
VSQVKFAVVSKREFIKITKKDDEKKKKKKKAI